MAASPADCSSEPPAARREIAGRALSSCGTVAGDRRILILAGFCSILFSGTGRRLHHVSWLFPMSLLAAVRCWNRMGIMDLTPLTLGGFPRWRWACWWTMPSSASRMSCGRMGEECQAAQTRRFARSTSSATRP